VRRFLSQVPASKSKHPRGKRAGYSHGESSLHRSLKEHYAGDGYNAGEDKTNEVQVDGFRIDVVREAELIEIQTRSFTSIKPKLCTLIATHPVRLVHPIPLEKWVIHVEADGRFIKRRKSPRRGAVVHVFDELVSFPELMAHPNLSLEVVLTREEEVQCLDGCGSWRRKGRSIRDRRLLEIVEHVVFTQPSDFLALLPPDLPEPFSSRDLASALGRPVALARRMTYCLRRMGAIQLVRYRRRTPLYIRTIHPASAAASTP